MKHNPKKLLNRREFLKLSGGMAGSAWLLANAPSIVAASMENKGLRSAPARQEGEVIFMMSVGELSDAEREQFMADNPGITLSRIDLDDTAFMAMIAAGNPPDIYRIQAAALPSLLARRIPKNLQSYFDASTVLDQDDLMPANNYYRANSPAEVGVGDRYGMVKDWSPDLTLFVNDNLFENAGVDPLSDEEPISYEKLAELAAQLTVTDGDRTTVYGFGLHENWIDRTWMTWLYGLGKGLFSEDFTQCNLVDNDEAREAIRYYFDLAQARLVSSPINPADSWAGQAFLDAQVAIVQYGFWFTGAPPFWANEEVLAAVDEGKIRMVPAPIWKDGEPVDPTITATGAVITDMTKVPDMAWRVYEWYMGKEPAITRAGGGWGIPAFFGQTDLVPKEGVFREQVWKVAEKEIGHSDVVLAYNPYLRGGEPGVLADQFLVNWEPALQGDMDFDEMLQIIEDETNFAIQDGIDLAG
jgi:multiple sugar transport system substrate-binding protein